MDEQKAVPHLFKMLPKLQEKVPYVPLMDGPTPIVKLERLGELLGHDGLYCKDDGVSTSIYGGNKPRKLEFILGEAVAAGAKRVITFGSVGSNHALATSLLAKRLGMATTAILCPQPITEACYKNILIQSGLDTELMMVPKADWDQAADELVKKYTKEEGIAPFIIPTGGTSINGTLGYVNAALELFEQIEAGEMPKPDVIYVPAGTFGAAAGLVIGVKLLNLNCEVKSIRISHYSTSEAWEKLLDDVVSLLRENGAKAIQDPKGKERDLIDDYNQLGYAIETQAHLDILETVRALENIELETTYTVKPMEAMMDDAKKGNLRGKVALYWRTNNSIDLKPLVEKGDIKKLPEDIQELLADSKN